MDFFSAQDAARKRTTVLIAYFVLAVACIICGVYGAVLVAWNRFDTTATGLWHPGLFLFSALGVVVVVLTGAVTKTLALSKGGEAVATRLGGVPLHPDTQDPNARRLLNVVEEMAIASGLPVPRMFVLPEEKGINAFAAGLTTSDAIVAVTAGCMENLSRDELQGVIGHEFSHILNGDMRLNVRLMGLIYGILIIASIGRGILRGGSRTRSSSSGKKGGGAGAILVAALILMAVGYIGVLFGRLIQASVSRQREFLADASAVQFTRNPPGLAGALKKIKDHSRGSRLLSPNAEEAGHFFFSAFRKSLFNRWFATHPPLEERIRRLDPSFAGPVPDDRPEASAEMFDGDRVQLSPAGLAAGVGSPRPRHISHAENIRKDLPPLVKEASREPFGAQALVYGLLLSDEGEERQAQLDELRGHADGDVLGEVERLTPLVDRIDRGRRLPLAEMAMPALRALSLRQYRTFRRTVQSLVATDRQVSLFEYALHRMLVRHLDGVFTGKKPRHAVHRTVESVNDPVILLLSALAWSGHSDGKAAQEAFRHGVAQLDVQGEVAIRERETCSFRALDQGLERMARATPALKKKLLMACVACVSHDQWLSLDEFELIRAVADSMDLPIPPLSPGPVQPA